MNKFNQTYISIICQLKNKLTNKVYYALTQQKQHYISYPKIIVQNPSYFGKDIKIIKIHDKDNIPSIFNSTNIIKETNQYFYGAKLLRDIYKKAKYQNPLSKRDIISGLSKNWEYYQKFLSSENHLLVPCMFDFNEVQKKYQNGFFYFVQKYSIFQPSIQNEFKNKNITKEERIKIYNNLFQNMSYGCDGLIIDLPDLCLMFFNSTYTLITVSHQLTHYMQIVLGVDLIGTNEKTEEVKSLNLSIDQCNYLFSSTEFIPHIKTDLCMILKKVYKKYRLEMNLINQEFMSIQEFVEKLIKDINSDPQNIMTSDIGLMWSYTQKDSASLRLFAATKILGKNQLFDKICEILRNYFI